MTVLKYWDGTAWQPVVRGPRGESGVGDLLAVQRQWGQNNAYVAHNTAGMAIYCNGALTIPLQILYTPPVDAWWCVSSTIGLIQKLDAAYHNAYGYLQLDPADGDNLIYCYDYEYQHSTVQTFSFRKMQHTYKLAAGVAYSCTTRWGPSGGSWQIHQGQTVMHMQGMAYRR